jgi:proteasome lid subunit RPN8/RPN11
MIDLFFQEIEEHFSTEYPREACGILCVVKGTPKWVPCTNVAVDDEEFIIDSKEYIKVKRTSDIVGIVHSHPDGEAIPSEADIANCNALSIPYYIFSYPEMKMIKLDPVINSTELYGREYAFGITDCFEAMRDYLQSVGIEIAPRIPFEDNWWNKDLDYFTDEVVKDWGFYPVELDNIKPNDLVTFNVMSDKANHCGVYLGNDTFYHHAVNRLSCRENLFPFWGKCIKRVYRYEA